MDHGTVRSLPLTDDLLGKCDCAVIITNHSDYDYGRIVEKCHLVVDTRNATRGLAAAQGKIIKI
jgi:UDP-N-acetyl-D-glucosamine dehydrogenase